MNQDIKYFIFDVESVADGDLIARTKYPGQSLSPEQAIRRFRQELLTTSGRDFIPYTFHIPVAILIAKVRHDLTLEDIVSLDAPLHRPHVMTRHFWLGWEKYQEPTWVTFNGRTFDLPLMEHAAYRYGIAVPKWFNLQGRSFEQCRNRYNLSAHIDLQEILTNFGATWFRGGLNLAASILGKPGKMDIQGDMVYDLYQQGRLEEISEYCRCDVLDSYFVFLRTMVLTGELTLEREQHLVAEAKNMLTAQADQHAGYRLYLQRWGDWDNPWTEPADAPATASHGTSQG
ncbi:MAG: hypothetical protein KatS3mg111_2004 [Pirellulaceae bacterium]|nr:MAG: hypothetical protein KatS3mg111_2004 [Pirellulaceae bacterium]